jgi:hypothetical protein
MLGDTVQCVDFTSFPFFQCSMATYIVTPKSNSHAISSGSILPPAGEYRLQAFIYKNSISCKRIDP